jgi:uncharacterized protein YecT (DUF1311 family)
MATAEAPPVAEAVAKTEAPANKEKASSKKEAAPKKDAGSKTELAALTKEKAPTAERASPSSPPAARLAKAEAAARTPAPRDACAQAPTPADRLVCSDLSLRLFDIELREAQARARKARVDPVMLGKGQIAWRRARDEVSDPDRLARLYVRRIRELEAATAAARTDRRQE